MKFSSAVLAIATTTLTIAGQHVVVVNGQSCIDGAYDLLVQDECTYQSLLDAFSIEYPNMITTIGCGPHTAEEELWYQLGATNEAEAIAATRLVCEGAWDGANTMSFEEIARSDDPTFEQQYYNGNTYWNEQTETSYPDGERRYVLREDAARVREFYDQDSEHIRVDVPGDGLTNNVDPATCTTNAVMCCWPRDRQAGDNNGNCNREYDLNCHDKNPADNTDLCYVDMERGDVSTGMGSEFGTMVFPRDDGNNPPYDAEGPIHCHGYAWAEDLYDHTARYALNNLFFVSMYDHMTQRGYVENIPGAPMCGCTDQMPTVSRSDCTQIDIEVEDYEFHYTGSELTAKLTNVEIEFNSCQGRNNQNNDLWAYMQRLYYTDKKVGSDKLAALAKVLVEDDNCPYAIKKHFETKFGLITGYVPDPTKWIHVAGRDALDTAGYGKAAFNALLDSIDHSAPNEDVKIIMRKCEGCERDAFKTIYYRRITPVPDNCDLLDLLKNSYKSSEQVDTGCNVYDVDFTMHSSYDDALAGTNPWSCPLDGAGGTELYRYDRGFPGDCSPDGTRVTDEDSQIDLRWGENNVGWYVEKGTIDPFQSVSRAGLGLKEIDINGPRLIGSTTVQEVTTNPLDTVYHVSGSGNDIWGTSDQFHFAYQELDATKDFYIKTRLIDMGSEEIGDYMHAKAGIMIRETLDKGSVHVSMLARIRYGIDMYWRNTANQGSSNRNLYSDYRDVDTGYMILSKQGSEVTGFFSHDGVSYTKILTRTLSLSDPSTSTLYVGYAVTSHDNNDLTTGTFDNLTIESEKYIVVTAVAIESTPVAPASSAGTGTNMDAGRETGTSTGVGGRRPGKGGSGGGGRKPGAGGREETDGETTSSTGASTESTEPEPYDNTAGADMNTVTDPVEEPIEDTYYEEDTPEDVPEAPVEEIAVTPTEEEAPVDDTPGEGELAVTDPEASTSEEKKDR